MLKNIYAVRTVACIICATIGLWSCEIDTSIEDNNGIYTDPEVFTGFDTEVEASEYPKIPKEMSLITLSDETVQTDTRVMLTSYMPPVQSQGKYGTCTSWATGYYARTIAYAKEHNLSTDDLRNETNQFSPLDIYLSIGHQSNCGGSSISDAFKTMQSRGIAKMSDVPYANLGNCSQKSYATSNQTRPGKINHYRRLGDISTEEFKTQLSVGRPIAVGCKLGPEFFSYKGGVLMDDDYSLWDAQGRHSWHAMCVVGFDDNKGESGAFLLANSWGNYWGDGGLVWVDYDFFTGGVFCRYAYIIESDNEEKPIIDNNIVDPSSLVEGKDIIATVLEDGPGDPDFIDNPGPRDRTVLYNVLNKGKSEIPASDDWNILYYYYNAYNPDKDFGIIFYDYYSDDLAGDVKYGEFKDFNDLITKPKPFGQSNTYNYINIPSAFSVGKALDDGEEYDMVYDYELPSSLNGEYYFVLFADGFNTINEQYEQNNYLFFTADDRKPVVIRDGVIQNIVAKKGAGTDEKIYDVRDKCKNAYSPSEISKLIQFQQKQGLLKQKVDEYRKKSGFKVRTPVKRLVARN